MAQDIERAASRSCHDAGIASDAAFVFTAGDIADIVVSVSIPQWPRITFCQSLADRPEAEETYQAISLRGFHLPVAVLKMRVRLETRMMVLMKGCQSVRASASPTVKTSTVRSSWRLRARSRVNAVSCGSLLAAMAQPASNRVRWFFLSWATR